MYCYGNLVSGFSLSSCGGGGEFLGDTKSWASRVFLAASTKLAMAGSWVFPSQIQGPVLSYFVFCRNVEGTDIGKRQILLFFVTFKLGWWIESFPSWQTVFPQQLVFDLDLHTGWGLGLTSYLIHRTKRFWCRIVLKTSLLWSLSHHGITYSVPSTHLLQWFSDKKLTELLLRPQKRGINKKVVVRLGFHCAYVRSFSLLVICCTVLHWILEVRYGRETLCMFACFASFNEKNGKNRRFKDSSYNSSKNWAYNNIGCTSYMPYFLPLVRLLLSAQTNHSSDSAPLVLNQSLYNVRVEGVLLVQIVILSYENQARFSKVPRSFSHPESHSKISNDCRYS